MGGSVFTSLVLVFLWKPKSFLFSREIFALSTRILDLDIYLHSTAYRIRVVAAMQWNYRDSNIIFTIVFYVYDIIYCIVCLPCCFQFTLHCHLQLGGEMQCSLSGFSILSSYRETNKYLHFYVQPTTTKKIVKETANSFLVLHSLSQHHCLHNSQCVSISSEKRIREEWGVAVKMRLQF